MPQYLARKFFQEHIEEHVTFLSRNLLVVPSSRDDSKKIASNIDFFTDTGKLKLEGALEEGDDCIENSFKQISSLNVMPLTKYVAIEERKYNIIDIDSDSELDLISSGYSNHSHSKDDIYHQSICSMVAKEETSNFQDLMLDEILEVTDDYVFSEKLFIMNPEKMREKLKPVMIRDPFKNNNFMKYKSLLIERLERAPVRKKGNLFHFNRFEDSCTNSEVSKMYLDEPVDLISQKEIFQCFQDSELNQEEIVDIDMTNELKKINVENKFLVEKFQIEDADEKSCLEEGYINLGSYHLLRFQRLPTEMKTYVLQSPLTFADVKDNDYDVLPDIPCQTHPLEDLVEQNNRVIFSPMTIKSFESKIRKKESTYADMLLMLLSVPSSPHQLQLPTIDLPPVDPINHYKDDFDDTLVWNPIVIEKKQLQSVSSKFIVPPRKPKQKLSTLSVQDFAYFPVDSKVKDFKVEDWKLNEKKLESLKYLTSYEKPKQVDGIPALKPSHVKAPSGYHANQMKSSSKVLSSIRSKPLRNHPFSTSTPQSSKIFESPVDAFIALRTGKINKQVNRSVAYVHPVTKVSAAKVAPMVNESLASKEKLEIRKTEENSSTNVHARSNFQETPIFQTDKHFTDSGFSSLELTSSSSIDQSSKSRATNQQTEKYNSSLLSSRNNKHFVDNKENINLFKKDIEYIMNPSSSTPNEYSCYQKTCSKANRFVGENESFLTPNEVSLLHNSSLVKDVDFIVASSNNRSFNKRISSNRNLIEQFESNDQINNISDQNNFLSRKENQQDHSENCTSVRSHTENACSFIKEEIELSESFKSIINAIVTEAQPLIQFLKSVKRINSQKRSLLDLTTELTSFLMKEEEKKLQQQSSEKDVLSGVVCLHGLANCIEIITKCGIHSCCDYLDKFNMKYMQILRNCLSPVKKKLLMQNNQNHPGFAKVFSLLKEWKTTSDSDELHILLIIDNSNFDFSAHVKDFLNSNNIKTNIYPSVDQGEDAYTNVFLTSCVIVALHGEHLESCPWKFFQYVIQYNVSNNMWYEVAKKENPHLKIFISLNVVYNQLDQMNLHQKPEQLGETIMHSILCSKDILRYQDLLVQLESNFSIKVLTKDYSFVPINSFQPDILIDERTCVLIITNDSDFSSNDLEIIELRVLSAIMKCLTCHIVLYHNREKLTVTDVKLTKCLSSLIGLIKSSFPNVICKLWNAVSTEILCEKLKSFCDMAFKSTKVWTKEQWLNKDWLSEEISKKECYLMSYPFINSICAQIMLQACGSLNVLMELDMEDLKNVFKWIPDHVLEAFYKSNHQKNIDALPEHLVEESYHSSDMGFNNKHVVYTDNNDLSFYGNMENEKQMKPTEPIADIIERENNFTIPDIESAFENLQHEKDYDSNQINQANYNNHTYVMSNQLLPNSCSNIPTECSLKDNNDMSFLNDKFSMTRQAACNYKAPPYFIKNAIESKQVNDVSKFGKPGQSFDDRFTKSCRNIPSNRETNFHHNNNYSANSYDSFRADPSYRKCSEHHEYQQNIKDWSYEPLEKFQKTHQQLQIMNDHAINFSSPPNCQRRIADRDHSLLPRSQGFKEKNFEIQDKQPFQSLTNDDYRSFQLQNNGKQFINQQQPFENQQPRFCQQPHRNNGPRRQSLNENSYHQKMNRNLNGLNNPGSIQNQAIQKRKLAYEKVPGATNGQTRLTFV